MGTIFVSHSEKDLGTVSEIIRGLEQAGYHTWYFERDVLPGTSYLVQIHDAVDQCDAVVLVVSSNSICSDQTTKEVVGAFERRKPFFPILLDMTPPELKQQQPEWRHALGGTAMIMVGPKGTADCVSQVVEGLKARGLYPEREEKTPSARKAALGASGRPLPTSLKERILSSRASMEGERKQVTVLFADVSSFTSMSEKLDPEEVHGLISEALVPVSEEIHRFEGTIVQFLGDGVMALFGAPIAHEDAPQRALHAALGIRERTREYAAKLKPRGIEFDMHIGLNSGLVMVGKIGDDLTMEYTAMGDTVNLASRLTSLAQPGTIFVSENTYRLTEGYFEFKALGEIEVKGKKQPVKAYQVLNLGKAKTRLGVSEMRGLTPFVGRQKELDQLVECYEQAKRGQGQVVGIVGEPGVGKSRLLLQLRSVLPQGEYNYLEGQCLHYGEAMAYLPIVSALRTYFDIEEGEAELISQKKLKRRISELDERLMVMLPPLQDLLFLQVQDEAYLKLEPQKKREKAFEAMWSLIIRESQNRLVILALEDLHWIDRASEEFLNYLIGRLSGAHVLLLLAYRPEYKNPWTSKTYYSQIRVEELSPETSAEMVQAMLKGVKAAPDLTRLVLDKSAGNPLFMEEFTRTLIERGYVQRRNGQYQLTVKPSDIQVPETVQGIIAARIDRLEEELKEIMQTASVIGRDFSYRILQAIMGTQRDLEGCLLNLQALEFIYERSLFPDPEYVFKHALTQQVAYSSLLLKKRKEIHERIGQAIEGLYPDRLAEFYEMLAYHYSRADSPDKAYHYLKLSADKATRNYANREALGFYQAIIAILNNQPDTEEKKRREVEILLGMANTMGCLAYPEGSIDTLESGERLSRQVGDDKSLAHFLNLLSIYHSLKGDQVTALRYAEDCFERAEAAHDVEQIAGAGTLVCMSHIVEGEFCKIAEVAPRAIAVIETTGRRSEFTMVGINAYPALCSVYGVAVAHLGDFVEGEAMCERGLRFALEIKDLGSAGWVEHFYAYTCALKGDGRRTVIHGQNAVRHLNQSQFLPMVGSAHFALGYGYLFSGDLVAAQEQARKGLEIERACGIFIGQDASLFYALMCMIHHDLGDWEKARSCAEEGFTMAQEGRDKWGKGRLNVLLGRELAKQDPSQSSRAEEYILQGIKIHEEGKVRTYSSQGYLFLGELYADTGRKEEALIALQKAQGMFREMGIDYWLARTEKALEKLKS